MTTNNLEMDSVLGSLFYGEIYDQRIFPFPRFSNEQSEMAKEMINAISKYLDEAVNSEDIEKAGEIPEKIRMGLGELGLMGLAVPEELGGMGLDYSLYSRVFAEVAATDASIGTFLGAHQSIGYRAILNEGTDEQKKKWLPKLASGEHIASFCLTEPGSGSDAYSIKTKAKDNKDGTYTINGQKLWITNAGLAEIYSVYCKTDHEINGEIKEKISCFIVEKSMPGVSFGEKEDKLGIKGSETRAVYFDNVIVPKENIIGELGKGFKISMNVLNSGRLSLASGCAAGIKSVLKLATEHASSRKQFDKPIKDFGIIQDKIADMAAFAYAAESMVYFTTGNMCGGMKDYYLETAACKIFCSEMLWKSVDMAMQIAGGNGYMNEYPYQRYMRDCRINLIFEGTNEILRAFLALSGMKGPSESLKELGKVSDVSNALKDPIKSLGVLTDFAKGRISKMMVSRSITKSHPRLEEWSHKFTQMLSAFAIDVENTLIKYGKHIIDNELPQKRIADMAIHLYSMITVLSRTTSILEDDNISDEVKDYSFDLAEHSLRLSRNEIVKWHKKMGKNSDKQIQRISDKACEGQSSLFEIMDY